MQRKLEQRKFEICFVFKMIIIAAEMFFEECLRIVTVFKLIIIAREIFFEECLRIMRLFFEEIFLIFE